MARNFQCLRAALSLLLCICFLAEACILPAVAEPGLVQNIPKLQDRPVRSTYKNSDPGSLRDWYSDFVSPSFSKTGVLEKKLDISISRVSEFDRLQNQHIEIDLAAITNLSEKLQQGKHQAKTSAGVHSQLDESQSEHCKNMITPTAAVVADFRQPPKTYRIEVATSKPKDLTNSLGTPEAPNVVTETAGSSLSPNVVPAANVVKIVPPGAVTTNPGDPFRVVSIYPEPDSPENRDRFREFRSIVLTFSHPVVPVSEIGNVPPKTIPVILTPNIPSKCRWLDQQTFLIEPSAGEFLPAATKYVLTIPTTIKSLAGRVLENRREFRFETGRPEGAFGTISPQRAFLLQFAQPVKTPSVLALLSATAGGRPIKLDLASPSEVSQIFQSKTITQNRFVFFPVGIKDGEELRVVLKPGVESQEGPLRSTKTVEFKTKFAQQRTKTLSVVANDSEVEPGQPVEIVLSEYLTESPIREDQIVVEPKIDNLKILKHDSALILCGDTKPGTTYVVTLRAGVRSKTLILTQDEKISFTVTSFVPRLFPPSTMSAKIGPNSDSISVRSINCNAIRVTVHEPSMSFAYTTLSDDHCETGTPIFEKVLKVVKSPDRPVTTEVSLSDILKTGVTSFVLRVERLNDKGLPVGRFESIRARENLYRNLRFVRSTNHFGPIKSIAIPHVCEFYTQYLQVADFNLTAVPTMSGVHCLATDYAGHPVSGVSLKNERKFALGRSEPKTSKIDFDEIARKQLQNVPVLTNDAGIATVPVYKSNKALGLYDSTTASKGSIHASVPLGVHLSPLDSQDRPRFLWFKNIEDYRCLRGHPIQLWGWIRSTVDSITGADAGEGAPNYADLNVALVVLDSQSQELSSTTSVVSENGGFVGQFTLPPTAACGAGKVKLLLKNSAGTVLSESSLEFVVAEELEQESGPAIYLSLNKKSARLGEPIFADAITTNSDGAPRAKEEISWKVFSAAAADYAPPGLSDFKFSNRKDVNEYRWAGSDIVKTTTDDYGRTGVVIDAINPKSTLPVILAIQAFQQGQASSANSTRFQTRTCLIHGDSYVGLKAVSRVLDGKRKIDIRTIVAKPDGAIVPNKKVILRVSKVKSQYPLIDQSVGDRIWESEVNSAAEAVNNTVEIADLEPVLVSASIDDGGKLVQTSSVVIGGESGLPPGKRLKGIATDREEYEKGDDCSVFVQSPFKEGTGYVVLDNGFTPSISMPIEIHDFIGSVKFPVNSDQDIPGLVKIYESEVSSTKHNLRSAVGQFTVKLVRSNRLKVDVSVSTDLVETSKTVQAKVLVRDAAGKPVPNADVILRLHPLASLNQWRSDREIFLIDSVWPRSSITSVSTDNLPLVEEVGFDGVDAQVKELARRVWGTVCLWGGVYTAETPLCNSVMDSKLFLNRLVTPLLRTDINGEVVVPMVVPDYVSEYQISCTAVSAQRFGQNETTFDSVNPVAVALNYPSVVGEQDEYSAVLTIRSPFKKVMECDLTLESKACEPILSKKIKVPVGTTTIVIKSAQLLPRLKIKVSSTDKNWVCCCAPDVILRTVNETVRYVGMTDRQPAQIEIKESDDARVTNLRIQSSESELVSILSAIESMCEREPQSSIEIATRAIALMSFHKLCRATGQDKLFAPFESIAKEDVCQVVKSLTDNYHVTSWIPDGKRNGRSRSSYVLSLMGHALLLANREGFTVDRQLLERVSNEFYSLNEDRTPVGRLFAKKVGSYVIYLQSLWVTSTVAADSPEFEQQQKKYSAERLEHFLQGYLLKTLGDEELGWLCQASNILPVDPSVRAGLRIQLEDVVSRNETTRAGISRQVQEGGMPYASDTVSDAILLCALLSKPVETPESDDKNLVSGAIKRLANRIERRNSGASWDGAFSSSMAILALCEYNVWKLENDPSLMRAMKVVTTDLTPGETSHLSAPVSVKKGSRFVVSVTYTMAQDAKFDVVSNKGISISRRFSPADKDSEVWRDRDGNVHCTVGSNIRETLEMVPAKQTDRIVLSERIPGGFGQFKCEMDEGSFAPNPSFGPIVWEEFTIWPQRIEQKGSGLRIFANSVGPLKYDISFTLRATSPGKYYMPPATVQTALSKDVFGATTATTVFVHDTDPRVGQGGGTKSGGTKSGGTQSGAVEVAK